MSNYVRSHELLSRNDSRLLVVDVQEKLISHIDQRDRVVRNCRRLIKAAGILSVPTVATEQYPRGLGATIPELAVLLGERSDKVRFSCGEVLGWQCQGDDGFDVDKVVVCGIESHVCVLQTCYDLLSQGFRVYVPADAVGSRSSFDYNFALQRLRDTGVVVTTTESVMFEWCEVAGTPEFKQISRLVTEE